MKLASCCRYCGNWTARAVDLVDGVSYPVCPVCKVFVFGSRAGCLIGRAETAFDRMQRELSRRAKGFAAKGFDGDVLTYKARRLRYRIDGGDLAVRCKCATCRPDNPEVGTPGIQPFTGFTAK